MNSRKCRVCNGGGGGFGWQNRCETCNGKGVVNEYSRTETEQLMQLSNQLAEDPTNWQLQNTLQNFTEKLQ